MANIKITDLTEDTTPADGDWLETSDISAGASKKVTLLNFIKRILNQTDSSFDWTSFVPTFTNLTVGNGTLASGYQKIGKTVHWYIKLTFGTTTVMGTNAIFTLPVNASAAANVQNFPLGTGVGSIGGTAYLAFPYMSSTSQSGQIIFMNTSNGATNYGYSTGTSSTVPGSWTTADTLFISGSYPAA